jgi:prepilin-type N-terminal cleavage/methylation domain-containing protein
MRKLNRKSSEGFTIIEVMIVLAIAGLIMLIVFMAVPALQRNSRNTQRKNDISSLLGAVNEYTSNHNGSLPSTAAQVTGLASTGYYSASTASGAGSITIASGATNALTSVATDDRVVIVTGAKCGGTNGVDAVAGSSRQVVILYDIEGSGGTWTPTCQSD